jgi:uncharacterized protein YjiS (DUF1127 family)
MSTQSVSSPKALLHENVFTDSRLGRLHWSRIVEIVLEWRRRALSRRELARLSALDLKDIGYPERAAAETAKPFWRE